MINQDYKYTNIYSTISEFVPDANSCYIFSYSVENRSRIVDKLIQRFSDNVNFVGLETEAQDQIKVTGNNESYFLKSSNNIIAFVDKYICKCKKVYLDVTGINARIAASILNNIITHRKEICIHIIYAEPNTYQIKRFKEEGVYNDLSEKIEGIEPLPGFANIIPDEVDAKFITILGFEGGRFTHLLEDVQPSTDNIIPIIGMPGYRAEYPFVTLWGNRTPLRNTGSWENIRYAEANSIVDIYRLLTKVIDQNKTSKLKIAPIGTKPHAIGSILFAIKHKKNVELVYDNPKREKNRSDGVGLIVETFASKLIEDI